MELPLTSAKGLHLGNASGDRVAFSGVTPVALPIADANQAAVTTTVGSAVATTGSTASSPYGYTGATQADAIVANLNALRVDVLAMNVELTALRTVLVSLGAAKGSA